METDTIQNDLPPLPLTEWNATKKTLHLFTQIAGKIKLKLMPYRNHWWNIPLYINSRGFGTGPMPYNDRLTEINFDFCKHELVITTNHSETETITLKDGLCVSEFYNQLFAALGRLGIEVKILARPYEFETNTPFKDDNEHCSYDKAYVTRFWKILSFTDTVLKEFSGRFMGKCSPVHLFWHSFDLAVTRFSGRKAPAIPGANKTNAEAYSHEVISAGFWAGDNNIKEPAFYSYTYPAPDCIADEPLQPEGAKWILQNGSPMALYTYADMLAAADPKKALLQFLESSYKAGVKRGKWDAAELAAAIQPV
jgi:hypothetical protein